MEKKERKNTHTQEVKNERFLMLTRQNNVRIFGIRCDKATNGQIDVKHEKGENKLS